MLRWDITIKTGAIKQGAIFLCCKRSTKMQQVTYTNKTVNVSHKKIGFLDSFDSNLLA